MGKKDVLKINMFPANEGDCILIEAGTDPVVRILVDGGTLAAWNGPITNLLNKSPDMTMDLFVVTHIDSDHIGGALGLFSEASPIRAQEVWFNALSQLLPLSTTPIGTDDSAAELIPDVVRRRDGTRDISFRQSELLTERIEKSACIWNGAFSGGAVLGGREVWLSPEVSLTVILPTKENLLALLRSFETELRSWRASARVGSSPAMQAAFERYCLNYRELTTETVDVSASLGMDIERLMGIRLRSHDNSVTNASSIAFILNACGRSALFLGDAPSQYSIPALQTWAARTGRALKFDVVKVPHHGAKQNNFELLDIISSQNYLISTDGKRHGHPSPETLAKIVGLNPEVPKTLFCNYCHDVGKAFCDVGLMEKYNYRVNFASCLSF